MTDGKGFFDTHFHLDHRKVKRLHDDVYSRFLGRIVVPAIDLRSNIRIKQYYDSDTIYCGTGLHPNALSFNRGEVVEITGNHTADSDEAVKGFICKQAQEEKVVCIGETGFDFFRMVTPISRQEEWFRFQIETAIQVKKPLILHIRNAHEAAISVLDDYSFDDIAYPGIAHCFTGNYNQAKDLIDRNFLLGIGGAITYSEMAELRTAISKISTEHFVLETDGPFCQPNGWKGPNTPFALPIIAETIAAIRKQSVDEIKHATYQNSCKLFGIPSI